MYPQEYPRQEQVEATVDRIVSAGDNSFSTGSRVKGNAATAFVTSIAGWSGSSATLRLSVPNSAALHHCTVKDEEELGGTRKEFPEEDCAWQRLLTTAQQLGIPE
jgi:hypothetical protein